MDITSLLKFGPEITYKPAEDAPSIYANPEEWKAYRAKQMLDVTVKADQALATQNQAANDKITEQLLSSLSPEAGSIAAEVSSLQARYPTQAALSVQRSYPDPKEGNPVVPTQANPQHAKQDQINKSTSETGVRAFTDANGRLVLTNNSSATDARSAMQPFRTGGSPGAFTPVGSTAQTGMASKLLIQLRGAKDLQEATALAHTLQEAAIIEAGKFQQNAMQFAESKVGLPGMRAELEAAIRADRADPMYRPGMGDSPITAKIRQQITQLEDQAQQESERFLSRNVAFAQLKNTAATAKSELDRFTKKQDWEDQREFQTELQRETFRIQQQERKKLEAAQMTAESKSRVLRLHPELASEEDPDTAIFARAKELEKMGGKAATDALTAPAAQLPAFAVRGNVYAEEMVINEEAANTGDSLDTIRGRMANAKRLMQDTKFLDKALNAQFVDASDKRQKVQEARSEIMRKRNGNAEDKEQARQVEAELALGFTRATSTQRFAQDLSLLGTQNVQLGDAIRLAQKNTGRSDLASVATAFVGDKSGAEAIAAYQQLKVLLEAEAVRRSKSVFGGMDMIVVRSLLDEQARSNFTALQKVQNLMAANTQALGAFGSFMPLMVTGAAATRALTGNKE